ncbi:hypothetical protein BUALT_Bualt01G0166100 [Buddleja alternifolia]|uniref:Uncharacterized protein n=1 Tax=Buddleja alternifolia TaxID=168488 RepID=A0AAV6Y8R9_9LAMI|nr:hypothetical protein BUALT_Bualt01G0166100 [Buddleja alternifolia]
MAALSLSPGLLCHFKLINPTITRSYSRRLFIKASCENRDPFNAKTNKENKEDHSKGLSVLQQFIEVGKGLKNTLSPKQKGDWKDIALMSLSFAVYVYMSQKIVCAYCAWMSMLRQPW